MITRGGLPLRLDEHVAHSVKKIVITTKTTGVMDRGVRYINRHWADVDFPAIWLARLGSPVKLQVFANDPESLILPGNLPPPSKQPEQINIRGPKSLFSITPSSPEAQPSLLLCRPRLSLSNLQSDSPHSRINRCSNETLLTNQTESSLTRQTYNFKGQFLSKHRRMNTTPSLTMPREIKPLIQPKNLITQCCTSACSIVTIK